MHVSTHFHGGNIDVVAAHAADDLQLRIRPDKGADGFFQWFFFRVSGVAGKDLIIRILNAGEASYPKGWEDYSACMSEDRDIWTRAETRYADGVLTIRAHPRNDSVYFAYFPPYSAERHDDLIATCQRHQNCRHTVMGETLDGASMDLLTIGEEREDKKKIWTIARQHPGETMAEWFMEGMLIRLLDPDDAVSKAILRKAVVHAVPNMNPDGSQRGHLRTNAKGINLNRAWDKASLENSPEVCVTLKAMEAAGLDFCLDVHGDEGLPYVFIAGADAIPSVTAKQIQLRERYEAALHHADPDFQSKIGYPKAPPGKANLSLCSAQLAERFGALAMTLEMPFKDNANDPDPINGWSIKRCRLLGAASLEALLAVVDDL